MPTLYYVRHGLTDWNAAGRLQGRRDVPLNDTGRRQAARCGEILRDLLARDGRLPGDYDYVSSPLVRASETMDILRAGLGLGSGCYPTDARLAEIAYGAWEGLTYKEIVARDQDIVEQRENNKWHFRAPGGETYDEVAQRMRAWYVTIAKDTVVTAHGGTARALVAVAGVKPQGEAVHHPIDQGVVYVFAGTSLARHD
jgi:broad specificity phosphatase PhoE